MNALALPLALRFNAAARAGCGRRFGEAIGAPDDPAAKVEELARLGGFERLRDFGVPEDEPPRRRPRRRPGGWATGRTRDPRLRPRSRSCSARSTDKHC